MNTESTNDVTGAHGSSVQRMVSRRSYYQDAWVTIYNADARELLPMLGQFDAMITDPPYGVNLGKDGATSIGKTAYSMIDDTPEYVMSVCVPIIKWGIENCKRVVLTPGTRNCFKYPEPTEMGAIFNPAGAGFSRWGFTCSQPILYYGKDPKPVKMPQSFESTATCEKNGHPCPKPDKVMTWLVNRASNEGETIIDPFGGSGTTAMAAKDLRRKCVLIEIDERYCEMAAKRMAQEYLALGEAANSMIKPQSQ